MINDIVNVFGDIANDALDMMMAGEGVWSRMISMTMSTVPF